MDVPQPAPDPADAEAEIIQIEQHVGELTRAIADAQQRLQQLAYRRCFLEGVVAASKTFDATQAVQVEEE